MNMSSLVCTVIEIFMSCLENPLSTYADSTLEWIIIKAEMKICFNASKLEYNYGSMIVLNEKSSHHRYFFIHSFLLIAWFLKDFPYFCCIQYEIIYYNTIVFVTTLILLLLTSYFIIPFDDIATIDLRLSHCYSCFFWRTFLNKRQIFLFMLSPLPFRWGISSCWICYCSILDNYIPYICIRYHFSDRFWCSWILQLS